MASRDTKDEGGMLPLAVLLGLMLLILAYGVQQGFLSDRAPTAGRKVNLVVVVPASTAEIYRGTVARFEGAHPDIGVEMRPITGPKYYQKLLVMMASGNPPDLMWMGQGFGEFAQRGAFLDVTARLARDVDLKRFPPEALSWYRLNGRQLGVPFLLDVGFIVYNKDVFDQAGVPYPTNDWDYDQFLQTAERMTAVSAGGRTTRYGYYGMLDPCLFGAQFISNDGTHATCDTPEMIRYLKVNNDLVSKYHVAPMITSAMQQRTSLGEYFLFTSGRYAMMQAYTWDLMPMREQCTSVRWGYVLNPKVERRGEWASSQAVLISSKTTHPDQAWQLCKEFFSPQFQRSMADIGLPSDLSVAKELAASGRPQYDHLPVLLAAAKAGLYPTPRVAHLSEARQIFSDASQSVWIGQDSARSAMRRAATLIDRMIQQQKRYGS